MSGTVLNTAKLIPTWIKGKRYDCEKWCFQSSTKASEGAADDASKDDEDENDDDDDDKLSSTHGYDPERLKAFNVSLQMGVVKYDHMIGVIPALGPL